MTINWDTELETQIDEWRAQLHRRRELHRVDAEELEDHPRSKIAELTEAGLHDDEAFLVAVKRRAAWTSCRGSRPRSLRPLVEAAHRHRRR